MRGVAQRDGSAAWRIDQDFTQRVDVFGDARCPADRDIEHFLLIVNLPDLGAGEQGLRDVAADRRASNRTPWPLPA